MFCWNMYHHLELSPRLERRRFIPYVLFMVSFCKFPHTYDGGKIRRTPNNYSSPRKAYSDKGMCCIFSYLEYFLSQLFLVNIKEDGTDRQFKGVVSEQPGFLVGRDRARCLGRIMISRDFIRNSLIMNLASD